MSVKKNGKLSLETFKNMSREEQLLAVAKANLEKYGTITPPDDALQGEVTKHCPHCDRDLPLDASHFGMRKRTHDGKTKPQSWCKECRASPDSHPTRNGL